MNSRKDGQEYPLVAIHNVTALTTQQVEDYCRKYDKNVRCFRKKNARNHPYVHALFSSLITATHFLNDRPHFIENCRINASFSNGPQYGPKLVCVRINKSASIDEDSLYEYASKNFGRVLNCNFFSSRGYGFIEFHDIRDVHRALASSNPKLNGCSIQFCPTNRSSRVPPLLTLTRLVHIGNFLNEDQDKLRFYFPDLQSFTSHQNCFGQKYVLGLFNINDSIKLLLKRAFCLNGRVLSIFMDNDDRLMECDNYLLVRHVPQRLSDYNLYEYFSQYGRVLNCYRYGQTDTYRVQYRDKTSLNRVLEFNCLHVIKSSCVRIEREYEQH